LNTLTTHAPDRTASHIAPDTLARAARIKLMAFDIDGVFTDGRMYFGGQGELMKSFNTLDGHGIKQLARVGIEVAIITGRRSDIVAARAAELGVTRVFQGVPRKWPVMRDLLSETGIAIEQAAYMGDDWPDLGILSKCGFACAPANAHPDVLARVHYVTGVAGGAGAVREVCDLIVKAVAGQDAYQASLATACEG